MMIRRANLLLVLLATAPVVYLIIAGPLELEDASPLTSRSFVLQVFFALALLSVAHIVVTVWVMTSKRLMSRGSQYGPIWRSFRIMSIGSILSQAQAVYGLILTLLSGSILYLVGFSLVAWASLSWVRRKFKQSLGTLSDT